MARNSFDHMPPGAYSKDADQGGEINPYTMGIDPELIPYLEPATKENETDSESTGAESTEFESTFSQEKADVQDLLAVTKKWLADDELVNEISQINSQDQENANLEIQETNAANPSAMLSRRFPTRSLENQNPEVVQEYKRIYNNLASRRAEHQINPALEKVQNVLDMLGSPQHLYPCIHVTGTNGKTSTARMIESLALALGHRTGRFTSPHLCQVTERIVLDGQDLTPEQFVQAWNENISPYVEWYEEKTDSKLSFFEALTVMALAYFADVPVSLGVIEVGMGGRWDATNVINATVNVFTPISREHEQWLGQGLKNIATEKSGIIKPNSTVVTAIQDPTSAQVIAHAAAKNDAVLLVENEDFKVIQRQRAVGGQLLSIKTPCAIYENIFLPLFGAHQAQNAACALVAVESLMGGIALDGVSVEKAFEQVSSPGRLEVIHPSPMTVIDGAHNPGAMPVLAKAIEDDLAWNYTVGVFSALEDKDIETMLGIMEPHIDQIVITQIDSERAASVEKLQQIAEDVFGQERVITQSSLPDAVEAAAEILDRRQNPAGTEGILVFGSLLLAGEARELFTSKG